MSDRESRELTVADAPALSQLLLAQRSEYLAHFHPFDFDATKLANILGAARRDWFCGLYWKGELAGFFMMRGLDEGYARPAFGVFVGEAFAGRGLARLALDRSLEWAQKQGCKSVMLKVSGENTRARALYLERGFGDIATCEKSGQIIMEHPIA